MHQFFILLFWFLCLKFSLHEFPCSDILFLLYLAHIYNIYNNSTEDVSITSCPFQRDGILYSTQLHMHNSVAFLEHFVNDIEPPPSLIRYVNNILVSPICPLCICINSRWHTHNLTTMKQTIKTSGIGRITCISSY